MVENGTKRGCKGRKAIIAKKKKRVHLIKQSCSESVKQTKNIYNLSFEYSFSERQSHKEKGGKN